jgi:tripartite-type tricarboxylate transporter receptor subunit TctC
MKNKTIGMVLVTGLIFVFVVVMLDGASAGAPKKESFPDKNIELVIPYGAGGGMDAWGRAVADYMGDNLPKGSKRIAIYCTNMVGASGYRAERYVWHSRPDGYTIGIDTFPGQIVFAKQSKWDIDPQKFAWIGRTSVHPFFIFVKADSGIKSLTDLKAKKRVKYASSSFGSGFYSFMATAYALGVKVDLITGFKSKNESILAVIRGDADVAEGSEAFFDWVKKGDAKCIAVVSDERSKDFPEVPTTVEQGYSQAGSVLAMHRLVFSTPGTPEGVLNILEEAFLKGMNDKNLDKWAKNQKMGAPDPMGRKEVAEMLKKAVPLMEEATKEIKLPGKQK